MITAQQFRPQQLTTYYAPAQLDMSQLLSAILPIMMLGMVFAMITPMFRGLTKEVA